MIASFFSADQKGGLGNRGSLPWPSHPEDMKWFKETTDGHIVVMGRKTWDDPKMPKPLPNRINAVITNRHVNGVVNIKGDIIEGIKKLRTTWPDKHIFIIGGAELIEQTKDLCDFAYIAHRKGAYFTDVRVNVDRYLSSMRIITSFPSNDRSINFSIYKNVDLFRPVI
jgi:dihydrofolate reductase